MAILILRMVHKTPLVTLVALKDVVGWSPPQTWAALRLPVLPVPGGSRPGNSGGENCDESLQKTEINGFLQEWSASMLDFPYPLLRPSLHMDVHLYFPRKCWSFNFRSQVCNLANGATPRKISITSVSEKNPSLPNTGWERSILESLSTNCCPFPFLFIPALVLPAHAVAR